jgi:mannose-6-phosphate isomerase-like protein (cupin superfamily)
MGKKGRVSIMLKTSLAVACLLAVLPGASRAQSAAPPKDALDVTKADIEQVRKGAPNPNGRFDQVVKVDDIGKYNVGVALIHQPVTGDAPPANAGSHDGITEVYIVLTGSATLTTGGAIINGRHSDNALPTGPGLGGAMQGGVSRHVGPGDVIIIPPGVPHLWAKVDEPMDVLVVRPDAEHVLPAGYVNPSLKKQ